jgi:hypothetical protein
MTRFVQNAIQRMQHCFETAGEEALTDLPLSSSPLVLPSSEPSHSATAFFNASCCSLSQPRSSLQS